MLLFRGQDLGDDAIMRTADIFGGSQESGAHSYFNRNAAAFNNQYLAYETLPAELRKAIEGRCQVHDASRNSAGVLRPGV